MRATRAWLEFPVEVSPSRLLATRQEVLPWAASGQELLRRAEFPACSEPCWPVAYLRVKRPSRPHLMSPLVKASTMPGRIYRAENTFLRVLNSCLGLWAGRKAERRRQENLMLPAKIAHMPESRRQNRPQTPQVKIAHTLESLRLNRRSPSLLRGAAKQLDFHTSRIH